MVRRICLAVALIVAVLTPAHAGSDDGIAEELRVAQAGTAETASEATMEVLLIELAKQQALIDRMLGDTPPVIRITSAPARFELGEGSYVIAGVVGDENGAPRRLTINGEQVPLFNLGPGDEKVAAHSMVFDVAVMPRKPGDQQFVIEAFDAANNRTVKTITVEITAKNRPNIKGRYYALVIGINDYEHQSDLKTAVNGAAAVAGVLGERYTFDKDAITLITNGTRNEILAALSKFRALLTAEDRLLIYYSGKGQIDPATDVGFWQPADAEPKSDFTWISNQAIKVYLRGMLAKHVLVIADADFSGSLTRGATSPNENDDKFFLNIDKYKSRKVIASGGTEPVADSGSGGHSVFTYYLIKALRDNTRPYITSFQLYDRLARAVANNSKQTPEFGTVHDTGDEGFGDFTFILRAADKPAEMAAESKPELQGVSLAPQPSPDVESAAPMGGGQRDASDLAQQIMELRRINQALQLRDVTSPSIEIVAPEAVNADDDGYRLRGFVGDDSDGPTVYVDGKPADLVAAGDGAPDLGAYTYAFEISLAIKDEAEVRHLVEARDSAGNTIAEWVTIDVAASLRPRYKGAYYALIIGNGDYDLLPPLETAEADAKAMAAVLNRRYVFDKKNTTVLLNATRREILAAINALKETLGRHDRLLIYFSGHSRYDRKETAYWAGADADETREFTWILTDSIQLGIAGMMAKHVLVIADAAFPLAVRRGSNSDGRDRYFENIDSYLSRKMITSGALEPQTAVPASAHSIFASRLLEALEANTDPYITSRQFFTRLARGLGGGSNDNPEWGTIADTGDEGSGEFTFILRAP